MVYNALDSYIVKDKLKYIKGNNLTEEQVKSIIEILYMNVNKKDIEKNYDDIFGDINIKIGFQDMNKENIKKIIFKNSNTTNEQVEEIINQYSLNNNDTKFFVIEFIN